MAEVTVTINHHDKNDHDAIIKAIYLVISKLFADVADLEKQKKDAEFIRFCNTGKFPTNEK